MDGQVTWSDLGFSFGRTLSEHSAATEDGTSTPCWKKLRVSQNQDFLYLDCRKSGNGQKQEPSTVMGGLSLGELTTLKTGEKPSETAVQEILSVWGPHSVAEESRLSQILEANPLPKYNLTAKACLGILRRAERRGKELPKLLKQVFLMQSARAKANCKQRGFKDGTDLVCSSVDCRNFREGGEVNGTLQAKESGGQSLNLNNTIRQNMVVRRLTPMECERLQGFPDHWTDIGEWIDGKGKKHKDADSPRYKALGNSIALPFWDWMLRRMARYLPEDATLGSLFDGIAGFPLIWERIHGKGTARWASEIEQFPIAVTKKHFPEEE